MLQTWKKKFLAWLTDAPPPKLSEIEQHEANKQRAYDKAIGAMRPDDREYFDAALKMAGLSNKWDLYGAQLFHHIENMHPDHQIVVVQKLVRDHPPLICSHPFARWARNNTNQVVEACAHGKSFDEFYARLAAD